MTPLTDGELDQLRQRLEDARNGPVIIDPPLPRKVRLRLWVHHRINRAGFWLVDHGRYWLAEHLWRACRMW